MSKSKQFDCPSCFAPMVFKGGESLFQTCEGCMAPVIVPSELYYGNEPLLASDDFASLMNDKVVDVEQVTNELTPGDELPKTSIADGSGLDVVIEKFDEFQEQIGSGSSKEKEAFDHVAFSPGDGVQENLLELDSPGKPFSASFDLIKSELASGDKVEAIKIFRETFNTDLSSAKDAVEALERGEEINLNSFIRGE